MNEYDSARMADVLREAEGLELTEEPQDADVLLVNTCSVREKAQEKVFSCSASGASSSSAARRHHRRRRLRSEPGGRGITARAGWVDLVFGPQTLHRLPQMIRAVRTRGRAVVDVSFPEIEKFDQLPQPRATGAIAYVSIMEGCSKYCTFCVVPYTRGEEMSRPFEQVMDEVSALAAQGVREVTLLGQNVDAYAGATTDGGSADLRDAHSLRRRARWRSSASASRPPIPAEFDDSLIEAYANVPKLAAHLHLPVQSGSDRILAQMKRGYTALEYKQRIRKLREVRPDLAVSSDFIIGFPGEAERDFAATMQLVEDVGSISPSVSFTAVVPGRPPPVSRTTCRTPKSNGASHSCSSAINANARAISEAHGRH